MGGKAIPICPSCDLKAEKVYQKYQGNRSNGQFKVKVWECPNCDKVLVKVQDTYQQGNPTVAFEGRIKMELVDTSEADKYE